MPQIWSIADEECFDLGGPNDCVSEYSVDESETCVAESCTPNFQTDGAGVPIVLNGWVQVDSYDCPANTKEFVVQSGSFSSCDEGTGTGEYAERADATDVYCVKTKFCAATCNVTAETITVHGGELRIAYCKSGGGPSSQCANGDHEGCIVSSQECVGECPDEPEEP
ncbi:hypothetical protein Poly59_08820 [Rubripirellula reticaptiva]|uniref:Uncharacterized protein n=1 Tax=Rubripirellula reticaptiva TaxID=2528013 RepID=A0A5C6F8A1_9BACT|nr:hypothetical protein Poly59_08820 [Rubripirellula reticaptiva]